MTAPDDPTAPDPLDATRRLWSSGSYATIGDVFAAAGEDVVARVGVEGLDVLDVACGTGNTTLAAARAGARQVTGVDVTPALLAEARRRAEAGGVADRVVWHESDMAALPVPDAAFDRVLSTFGAMFATDQARVAGELRRACRPGGTVAVTAWAIDGTFDRMTMALMAQLPALPPPGPSPRDWARPEALAAIFGLPPDALAFEGGEVGWRSADPEEAAVAIATHAGSVLALREALGEDAWPAAHDALVAVFAAVARPAPGGAGVVIPLEYTVATFTEPGPGPG